jgi:copper chaperone CopZ
MIYKQTFWLLTLCSLACTHLQAVEEPYPEAKQEERAVAAKAKLTATPDTVTVFAKGLCCPSCAIGIRKKVGKLNFVDTKRLKKGVDLDAKMQLATIALKKGQSPDTDMLAKAIHDAGYTPVQMFQLSDGKVEEVPLPFLSPKSK